ncbi:hypothetical protein BKA69DRAFT_119908 [Paraphysoderma sedebokerense]|nr:hypothetical protein BKA69DRAFT_119908 [Paraphysoderma sedebokerense]
MISSLDNQHQLNLPHSATSTIQPQPNSYISTFNEQIISDSGTDQILVYAANNTNANNNRKKTNSSLTDEQLTILYQWVDEIPLSKVKRNFTRDFSDGVLTAEIIRHYLPKLVDLHNYPSANSTSQKLYNWNTLSYKVFRKLGYQVSDETINSIVHNKPGVIESVLWGLKEKIEKYQNKNSSSSPTAYYETIDTSMQSPSMLNHPFFSYPQPPYNFNQSYQPYYTHSIPPLNIPNTSSAPPPPQQTSMLPKLPTPPIIQNQQFASSQFSTFQRSQSGMKPRGQSISSVNESTPTNAKPQYYQIQQPQQPHPQQQPQQQPQQIPQPHTQQPAQSLPQRVKKMFSKTLSKQSSTTVAHPTAIPQVSDKSNPDKHAANGNVVIPENEKDAFIAELTETIEMLQLKIEKLQQLLTLKDKKIQELSGVGKQ